MLASSEQVVIEEVFVVVPEFVDVEAGFFAVGKLVLVTLAALCALVANRLDHVDVPVLRLVVVVVSFNRSAVIIEIQIRQIFAVNALSRQRIDVQAHF